MNRKQAFWASAVLALTLGFSACTKKAEQSTQSQPAPANATQPNANAPANSAAAPTPHRNGAEDSEPEPTPNGNAMANGAAAPATNGNTQTANGNTPATVTPGASPMASSPIGTGRVPVATPRSASAAPTPAPVPVITLPAGTAIAVHIDNPISTKTAEAGQGFEASVAQAVTRNGETVIPVGARAAGAVTNAAQAGRFKGGAQLGLRLTRVTIKGQTYDVSTS